MSTVRDTANLHLGAAERRVQKAAEAAEAADYLDEFNHAAMATAHYEQLNRLIRETGVLPDAWAAAVDEASK